MPIINMGRKHWITIWYTSIIWVSLYAMNDLAIKYLGQDLSKVLAYSIYGINLLWVFAIIAVLMIFGDYNREY